ncbi:MAG: L-histidine N(alpha)-methyltransferase [Xanthomonadales bacterium]
MNLPANATLHDCSPTPQSFREAVVEGLSRTRKTVPCQFFYDARGSELFEAICRLPEYYPTRTELGILAAIGPDLAAAVGRDVRLVEFGCGSSRKVAAILDHLNVRRYVPIDISRSALLGLIDDLHGRFGKLRIEAVCADFTDELEIPDDGRSDLQTVGFYPGSTIGNFDPEHASAFLNRLRGLLGAGGFLIVGVDLKKPVEIIEQAYNDAAGVTAAFNRNLLRRINRELDGTFEPRQFAHRAFYDAELGRVEMHLVSEQRQEARVDGETFAFREAESIHTENSYKYSLDEFRALARDAGYATTRTWTDPDELFSIHLLRVAG